MDRRFVLVLGHGIRRRHTALVDDLQVGDYVILHVGYALSRLDEVEAQKTLAAMAAIGATGEVSNEIH